MLEDTDVSLVSRSYLTIFFMDINTLKDSLTGYRSIMLRLNISPNQSYDEIEEKTSNLDEKLKSAIVTWSDSVRHNVERCQIAVKSLTESLDYKDTEKIDQLYEKIVNQFAPDLKDVQEYAFEINKIFVKNTLDKLLNKMETFYEQFTTNE